MRPIRTYEVTVQGWPPALYSARTPAKARVQCWWAFSTVSEAPFRDFLKRSTIRRVPDPPGVGERIMVSGVPATRVIGRSQYVHFMRDDSDQILCSHPSDVSPFTQDTPNA